MSQLAPATYLGDCLDVLPTLPAGSVNLVLCDLPYSVTACAWDQLIPFAPLWDAYKRVLAPGGAVVLTAAQPFTSRLICSNLDWFRYSLVWEKQKATGWLLAKRQPLRAHEDICIFSPKAPPYFPQKTAGKPYDKGLRPPQSERDIYSRYGQVEIKSEDGSRYPRSVQKFKTADAEKFPHLHKTQKPQGLLQWCVKTYSQPGDLVLDNAAGSFATGVACLHTGRRFIGIERDPDFYAAGTDWLQQEYAKLAEQVEPEYILKSKLVNTVANLIGSQI